MKVGLYFGSFNPIHHGHLLIASYVLQHTALQQIWFVVSPQNPLKPDRLLSSMNIIASFLSNWPSRATPGLRLRTLNLNCRNHPIPSTHSPISRKNTPITNSPSSWAVIAFKTYPNGRAQTICSDTIASTYTNDPGMSHFLFIPEQRIFTSSTPPFYPFPLPI